ncbi:MAG: hypothetical protein NT118_11100 [Lentisphaerae bacterium]|nr:hypothetical protein [Lentisphaerota bacterium]
MNADIAREKYVHLMTEIEALEDNIEKLERKAVFGKELEKLKGELAVIRNELARISDGCGTPHAH